MSHSLLQNESRSGLSTDGAVRRRMVLIGILQGIGCRPTIYRLASGLELAGWVVNTTSGVIVEIEGASDLCDEFQRDLPSAIPFPGRIDQMEVEETSPMGETAFLIRQSLEGERTVTPIPPDTAVCPECVEELLDPDDHRYLYPFITCTLCGPRFTVVRSFPYDRDKTSMADFTMCPQCEEEYQDPADRRFHSQTNSCPVCGPTASLVDNQGKPLAGDPIKETIRLLWEGKIVAVKGIGGFHLACDALNEKAVGLLRDRKGREEKPFAVMVRDLETAKLYCDVSPAAEKLLTSPVAPIVLLPTQGKSAAPNTAPFVGTLGVMLPYSPIHHLLFKHPEVAPKTCPSSWS